MALSYSIFVDAHRITSNDYIPSNDDVLRAPVPVLTEIYFPMGQLAIRLCHISQRSERKKWIHSFENVTSIIFCASLADYNRFRYKQGRILCSLRPDVSDSNLQIKIPLLAESLVFFESVINSRWFLRTSIILLVLTIKSVAYIDCGKSRHATLFLTRMSILDQNRRVQGQTIQSTS